jgi:hypothetical protein
MGTPARKHRPDNNPFRGPLSGPIFDDGPIAFEAPNAPVRPEHATLAWDAAQRSLFTKRGTLRKHAERDFATEAQTKSDPSPDTSTESADTGTFKLPSERRKLPRRSVSGHAMAVFANGRGAGTLTRVELIDASWTGMGLKTNTPVEPGTSVSVIPEHAMSPRQVGIVVRCEPMESGYSVGLMCRTQKAVA